MKQTILAVLLAMFLAAGCAQPHVTRFEYGDIHLDVSGRIIGGKSIAMVEYKPGIYYSIDRANRQIQIDARLVSVKGKDLKEMDIRGIRWLTNSRTLIAATNIKNTTPMKSPPFAMGGLVNISGSIGGGRGGGGTKCIHGGNLDKCTKCSPASDGTGIDFPVFGGSAGKDNENVLSVRATFDLDESIDIEESYVAIDIQISKMLNKNIRTHMMILPMKRQPKVEPKTETVMERRVNAVISDRLRIEFNGLIEGENKKDIIEKTPLLGNIPLLGRLFKSSNAKTTRDELIVFITPKIVLGTE